MAFKSTNIGAEVALGDMAYATQASAGAINGGSVDVKQDGIGPYDSGFVVAKLANITGAPTGQTLTVKVQDSPDGSTWSDYKPDGQNVAQSVTGLTAAGLTKLNVNLKYANRYVRAVANLGFTGGTTPKADVQLALLLGGAAHNPVTDPNP